MDETNDEPSSIGSESSKNTCFLCYLALNMFFNGKPKGSNPNLLLWRKQKQVFVIVLHEGYPPPPLQYASIAMLHLSVMDTTSTVRGHVRLKRRHTLCVTYLWKENDAKRSKSSAILLS